MYCDAEKNAIVVIFHAILMYFFFMTLLFGVTLSFDKITCSGIVQPRQCKRRKAKEHVCQT